ncbi:MAG: 16S rRNA (guanine(527)-N(7))-methyltransferase RsmG [Candidatus Wallbacteria bacterium]
MEEFITLFNQKYADYFGEAAKREFAEACFKHYEMLLKYNESFNLTRITTVCDSVLYHYIDSIFVSKALDIEKAKKAKFADIGSGGGFPAFPLYFWLAYQKGCDVEFTMFESSNKKSDFLNIVAGSLGVFKKVKSYAFRAEEAGADLKFREKFDFVTARAVSAVPVLMEYCAPLLKVNGSALLMKGLEIHDEISASINAQKELSVRISKKSPAYEIEGLDRKRQILIIEKYAQTKKIYPRNPGMAKKLPL